MHVKMHSGVLLLDTGNLKFVIENTMKLSLQCTSEDEREKANG